MYCISVSDILAINKHTNYTWHIMLVMVMASIILYLLTNLLGYAQPYHPTINKLPTYENTP